MGVIRRSLNQEANQRVAAARVLEVGCMYDDLPVRVQDLFDSWNSAADAAFEASLATKGKFLRWASSGSPSLSRHYFLLAQPAYLIVTFGVRAVRVAERGFNPQDRGWLARITPEAGGDGRPVRISVTLSKWVVDDNGHIWNGGRYVQMLDGLVEGLNGRYISSPVDEEDHRFIGLA